MLCFPPRARTHTPSVLFDTMVVVLKALPEHTGVRLQTYYTPGQALSEAKVAVPVLVKIVLHTIIKNSFQELRHNLRIVGNHGTYSYSCVHVDHPAERMDISEKPHALFTTVRGGAQNYYAFSEAQRHGDLSVLAEAVCVTSEINERLCALDHQALNNPFVFMSFCSALRGIEITKSESPQAIVVKDEFTIPAHFSEVRAPAHARRDVDIKLVHDGQIQTGIGERHFSCLNESLSNCSYLLADLVLRVDCVIGKFFSCKLKHHLGLRVTLGEMTLAGDEVANANSASSLPSVGF